MSAPNNFDFIELRLLFLGDGSLKRLDCASQARFISHVLSWSRRRGRAWSPVGAAGEIAWVTH